MARKRRPWAAEDDRTLRVLHTQGGSLRAAAAVMDRTDSIVRDHSEILKLDWNDRIPAPGGSVARAQLMSQEQRRARRATLRDGLLDDMERLRGQIFSGTTVFNFGGKENTYAEHDIDQPTNSDQLRLVQAINTGVAAIERLDKLDVDSDTVVATSMLDGLAAALHATADHIRKTASALTPEELQQALDEVI